MKPSLILLLSLSVAALLSSCAKDDKFVYYRQEESSLKVSRIVKVKEVIGESGVDLLWVIDNSGSMSDAQRNVSENAKRFMDEFVKSDVDWKLGLISTDVDEDPYLGFSGVFNSRVLDPIGVFQSAVGKLGTSGSGIEQTFDPIIRHLTENPSFLRRGTALATIIVTDAKEQSDRTASSFLHELKSLAGEKRSLYTYGVFAASDFGCTSGVGEDAWVYEGSPYEEFIKGSKAGEAYPMCKGDYGTTLAAIGNQISQNVRHSSIYLSSVPQPSTIRVTYKGTALPGGSLETGGYWYYDTGMNSVVFYSLDFSTEPEDSVSITYDKISTTH